jgi:hypothetical protein
LAGRRKASPQILRPEPGLERNDHAFALQPLEAAFNAFEIIVAGRLVTTRFRDWMFSDWGLRD